LILQCCCVTLAVRYAAKRLSLCDPSCSLCSQEQETTEHLILQCCFANEVWHLVSHLTHDLVRCQTRAPPLLRSDNQRSYRGQKRDHNVHCLEHLKGEEPTHFRAHLRRWCSDTAGNTIGGFQFGSSPVVGWWFLFYHVKCSLSSSSRVFEFWILFVLCNITIVLNLLILKWYSSSPAFPSKKKKRHTKHVGLAYMEDAILIGQQNTRLKPALLVHQH